MKQGMYLEMLQVIDEDYVDSDVKHYSLVDTVDSHSRTENCLTCYHSLPVKGRADRVLCNHPNTDNDIEYKPLMDKTLTCPSWRER